MFGSFWGSVPSVEEACSSGVGSLYLPGKSAKPDTGKKRGLGLWHCVR
jgi:hypothetical protein